MNSVLKIGDIVQYGTDWYKVVGFDEKTKQWILEPEDTADPVQALADRIWVDPKDLASSTRR
ncbi:MAG: hypothetical protein LAN64_01935 [Acidobacteriia bacterium]|nr:hypothetical protein [Terriglobia bacterium]